MKRIIFSTLVLLLFTSSFSANPVSIESGLILETELVPMTVRFFGQIAQVNWKIIKVRTPEGPKKFLQFYPGACMKGDNFYEEIDSSQLFFPELYKIFWVNKGYADKDIPRIINAPLALKVDGVIILAQISNLNNQKIEK